MRIKAEITIKNAEMATAVLLSAIIVFLLVFRTIHAGALWRDECGAVQLASMPSFSDIAGNFQHEAFPLLFPALLRMYTGAFGTSDAAFRFFGFLAGLMLVAMLWYNARAAGCGPPLLSLVLIGLNSNMLVTATSVRGYGLGCVLILLFFGIAGRTLRQSKPGLLIAVFLVSLAAVHCLVYNVILVLSITGAVIFVLAARRRYRDAVFFASLVALSALSMVPYYSSYAGAQEWNMLVKYSVDLPRRWLEFNRSLGEPMYFMSVLWHGLLAAVIAGSLWRIWRFRQGQHGPDFTAYLFYLTAALLSLAAYLAFLQSLKYMGRPWYYLALLCVVAVSIDVLAFKLAEGRKLRMMRLALAAAAMIAAPIAAWPRLLERQTTIDMVANILKLNVKNSDLIIVNPWYYGISFNWYYSGAAPWVTLPIISEHRMHRYDLLKEKMMSERPLVDLYSLLEKTLRENHRVWFAGDIRPPSDTTVPPKLPPAPTSRFGWCNWVYTDMWARHARMFLDRHSARRLEISIPVKNGVSELENASLLMAEGWK